MPNYEVTFTDQRVERIEGADAYAQEGPMVTFFATAPERGVVDSWSARIASFRTAEVMIVRRLSPTETHLRSA